MEKHIRAKHAILAGADAVIELPAVFATSNGELFAKGAIALLNAIPSVKTLCFGAEKADKLAFVSAARYLNDEPKEVSEKIQAALSEGASYAKARAQAWAGFIPFDFLSAPNNILGVEYTKALLASHSNISILPIQRQGGEYADAQLRTNFSSATAIRAAITQKQSVDGNVPDFVGKDLPTNLNNPLDCLEKYALLARPAAEIKKVCDCTEGLENAFKKAAILPKALEKTLTSPRYTSSRIRRIALQNLLNIEESLIRECLQSPLYLRVLGIKKSNRDILTALSKSNFPLLIRAHDEDNLTDVAKQSLAIDTFAEKIYGLLYPNLVEEKQIFF